MKIAPEKISVYSKQEKTHESMPPNASRMVVVGVSPTLSGVPSLYQTMETRLKHCAAEFGLGIKVPHYRMWT